MKKTTLLILLLPLLAGGLCSCASKSEEEEKAYSGKFMENDRAKNANGETPATLTEVYQKEREKREEKRLKFQDVSRPMNQDSYKVFPWKSDSSPRSEQLHDASREGSNSLF